MKTRDLYEALKTPRPPIEWLIEEWIGTSGLHLIAGAPKTGKSLLMAQMALAIGSGEPTLFLQRRLKRARILLLELEGSESSLLSRMTRIATERDLPISRGEVTFAVRPDLVLPRDIERLRDVVEETGAEALFIDPLAMISPGMAENDSGAMVALMHALGEIAKERAIILLAHTSKPPAVRSSDEARDPFHSIRGSSALFGAVDSAAILETTTPDGLLARLIIRPRDAKRSTIDLERGVDSLRWQPSQRGIAA